MSNQKIVNDICKGIKKHAPLILSICAGIGVVATAILSEKAGERAERIRQRSDTLGEKEIFKESVKAAAPPVISAVITIFCICSAHVLNKKAQANLAAMVVTATEGYRQYRKANIEVNGEEADDRVINALQSENAGMHLSGGLMCDDSLPADTGEDILVWTEFTGFVNTTVANLVMAEHHMDRLIVTDEVATLEDFCTFLGIPLPEDYEDVDYGMIGWSVDYLLDEWETFWLDFYHKKRTTDDGLEYYEIMTLCEPIDLTEYKAEFA